MSDDPRSQSGGQVSGADGGMFLCRAMAIPLQIILHDGLGMRFIGIEALAAAVLMILFPAAWPMEDPRPMYAFILFYLTFWFIRRVETLRRRHELQREHSRYSGWPRLMSVFRRRSERTVKRLIEPTISALAGAFLYCASSSALGAFLLASAACLFIVTNASEWQEQQRAIWMNDALIEQRQTTERFRRMSGNGE